MSFLRIPSDTLEEIKERANIYEVISEHVVLKKRGKNYVGLCPFHNEKTPSFSVNPDKQLFYCFGCGAGGNAIKFLMELKKEPFHQVVLELAKQYKIPIKELESENTKTLQEKISLQDQLYEILATSANYYEHLLHEPSGTQALDYLINKRRLKLETISKFNIGYSPEGWETLYSYLVEYKKYSTDLLEQTGMIKRRNKGNGYYDTFRGRIMIPIKDVQGRIVAFGGRSLNNQEPKYLNSPETALFSKSKILFALDQSYKNIRNLDQAIVVEGYFDVISLHEAGINNTVASLGTTFSKAQLRKLLRYTDSKQIVFNFDADNAGIKATQRMITEIESLVYSGQVQLKILNLPNGKDADEFIQFNQNSTEQYYELISNAPLWFSWQIQQILLNKDLKRADHFEKIVKEMIDLLSKLSDYNKREYYIRHCSEVLSQGDARLIPIYLKNFQLQLAKPIAKQTNNEKSGKFTKVNILLEDQLLKEAENNLLKVYLRYPEYRSQISKDLESKNLFFSVQEHRVIWAEILEFEDNHQYDEKIDKYQLIYKLQETIWDSSLTEICINQILNFSELEQHEENDIERLDLIIKASLIFLEKASLKKYCYYCKTKYQMIDKNKDLVNFEYYLNEYIASKQKILLLQSLQSCSQLNIKDSAN